MSLKPLTRYLCLSIKPKIPSLQFTSTTSLADTFRTHLLDVPNNISSNTTLENSLNLIRPKLDTKYVNDVIHKWSLNNSHQMALRFFIWAGGQSYYKHNSFTYRKAFDLFEIKQSPQVLFDLIEAYKVEKLHGSLKMFKVFLNLCKVGGLANEALLVLRKMPEFNVRPDTPAYNIVIGLFCDKGEIDMAHKLFGDMGLIDLHPDMVTFLTMIKGYCNSGKLEEACGLFMIMWKHGFYPNVDAFSALLDGVCEFGNVERVFELLKKMDTPTYNIAIGLFCDKGEIDMAHKLFGDMCLINLHPNMVTFLTMIKGYCNSGKLEEACGLFMIMGKHDCYPNVAAFSALLDGVCKFGNVERVFELLTEMENGDHHDRPCVFTYTSLIQSFCEKGRTKDALAVLDRMQAFGCAPHRVTASVLINGLCMAGQLEAAYKFIDRVVAGGSVSNGDCYSALVTSLIKIKKLGEAEKLFRRVLDSGMEPDSLACSMMIKELCLEERMLDGFRLLDEIEKMGFLSSIDLDLYSTLLAGLCQQSHSTEAARLARSMLQKRIPVKTPYAGKIVEQLTNLGEMELVAELNIIRR